MKKTLFILLITSSMIACKSGTPTANNPFLADYSTPFEIPPFNEIKNEHYLPALKVAIEEQLREVDQIVSNKSAATFENTILPLDVSGRLVEKVNYVFYNINGTDNNDSLQAIDREFTPLMTKHADDISMNAGLFVRVKSVYDNRFKSGLDTSQIRTVEKFYTDFARNGANLSLSDQDSLRKLNEQISVLKLKFNENLLAETNDNFLLVIDDVSELDGLPQANVDAALMAAKELGKEGQWVFTLQKPSWIPFLQYVKNRDLREKLYRGYFMRGNNGNQYDNNILARDIVNLRAHKAKLLGFDSYGHYVIDENMAKTPDKVNEFIYRLWTPALEKSKEELSEMQKIADAEGANFKLKSWDWWYYAEKLRKQKYDFDESELTPYFQLEKVRDGMLWLSSELFGITFEKVDTLPVYNPEVETYIVKDQDGSLLGVVFFDYFPRSGKRPGAWCTSFRPARWENNQRKAPLVSMVCNFTRPINDLPSLLTWDEVTTLFHEFGHGLHGLFETGKYSRIIGDVERDFVEFPSQVLENWAAQPLVLKHYAKHYKTGETIPDELIEKIENSRLFNQGFVTVEYLAATILDLKLHSITTDNLVENIADFEKSALDEMGLIEEIVPRYKSTYFAHIYDNEYAAGYYVYIWADVLAADAFNAFVESGDIFNKDLAQRYRRFILAESGEGDGMDMYRLFRGKDPDVSSLLKQRGLD